MTFELRIDRRAQKGMDSVPEGPRKRILEAMRCLREDPFRPRSGVDIKRLHGKPGVFRLRLGEYRIFYVIFRDERIVFVTDVRNRSHAYD